MFSRSKMDYCMADETSEVSENVYKVQDLEDSLARNLLNGLNMELLYI
jgi:hypothetical protein